MDANTLVVVALIVVVLVIGVAAWVLVKTPDSADLEGSKIRFAAATFTGILLLIIFSIVVYFASPTGPGKEVFSTIVSSLAPIAGAIVGYLFGTRKSPASGDK
jgi:hypothetical protein